MGAFAFELRDAINTLTYPYCRILISSLLCSVAETESSSPLSEEDGIIDMVHSLAIEYDN